MRKGSAVLLRNLVKNVFHVEPEFDEKNKSLVASIPIGYNEMINLKYYENIDGYPVLVLNMPEILWGKGDKFYLQLISALRWKPTRKSKIYKFGPEEFNGHPFHGWQPNDFYPMRVYLWNKKGWNETRINRLILGVKENEV